MFVKQLGQDNAKIVDVPESKPTKEELDERAKNKIRSINRVDLDTVVKILDKDECKNLAKKMQTPKKCDMQRLKISCRERYPSGHRSDIELHERQRMPKMMTCYSDLDHTGDFESRGSTIDQVIVLDTHCVNILHECNEEAG